MKYQFIKLSLFSILFGIISGILGGIIVYIYLFSYMNIGEIMVGVRDERPVVMVSRIIDKEVQKTISSSLVTFYRVRPESQAALNNIYLESDKLGYGFIITSDGWVVTSGDVLNVGLKNVVVATNDGSFFSVKNIEKDEKSGVVFVRLEASNLNPVAFGDSRDLKLGEELYVFDSLGKTTKLNFYGLAYEPVMTRASVLRSSEEFDKNIFFGDELDSDFSGAPLMNYRGEVVGVIKDSGGRTTEKAIPFHYVYSSMQNLFRNGKISKTFLGIQYIDLSHTLFSTSDMSDRGALVLTGGGGVGVLKHSPAWDAGIQEGDIILRIGNDELNEDFSLSERIIDYQSEDVVDFVVLRDGEERIIGVRLGELK